MQTTLKPGILAWSFNQIIIFLTIQLYFGDNQANTYSGDRGWNGGRLVTPKVYGQIMSLLFVS